MLLVAEIEDLAANPVRAAQGTVLEASLDRRQGPVATLLVQNGTLRVGDAIAAGGTHGRVSRPPSFALAGWPCCTPRAATLAATARCALLHAALPPAQHGTAQCADTSGRVPCAAQVRSMRSVAGEVGEAGPSIAVQMHGLSSVPTAGDEFAVYATETEVRAACPRCRFLR